MPESFDQIIEQSAFTKEAAIEKEANEYGEAMDQALIDLVVEKAKSGSEEELRETLKDANELRRTIHSINLDYAGHIVIDAIQPRVDELVTKYGLDAEKFSMQKLKELLDSVAKE